MSEQDTTTDTTEATEQGATPNDVAEVMRKGLDEQEPQGGGQQGEPADEPLGEPGKRALAAEREYREAAEREAREYRQEVEQLRPQVEAIPATVASHLRDHLVTIHQISDEDRDLFLTSNDPATLLRQAHGLTRRDASAPTTPKPDLSQGGSAGTPRPQTAAEKFAAAFEGRV